MALTIQSRNMAVSGLRLRSYHDYSAGWIDGYDGKDPVAEYSQEAYYQSEYERGWLEGSERREKEQKS